MDEIIVIMECNNVKILEWRAMLFISVLLRKTAVSAAEVK